MQNGEAGPLTDLHTHILPGVDDGAADLGEALAMARAAVADGIRHLAATPHAFRSTPVLNPSDLRARVAALQRALAEQDIPLSIAPGAEMPLIVALPAQIDAGQYLTLNGSRYLLVEMPYFGLPGDLSNLLWQVQARGLVPILAHPERNAGLQRNPQRLRPMVERGLRLQITAASLEGLFGPEARRTARHLLQEGLVHIIASDAHPADLRPPRLSKAQALAAEIVGVEGAQRLVSENPAAILANGPLPEAPRPVRQRRWWRAG